MEGLTQRNGKGGVKKESCLSRVDESPLSTEAGESAMESEEISQSLNLFSKLKIEDDYGSALSLMTDVKY
jgi:hypothetical protein